MNSVKFLEYKMPITHKLVSLIVVLALMYNSNYYNIWMYVSNTEWHLYSVYIPLIIPTLLMQGLVAFLYIAIIIFLIVSFSPNMPLVLGGDEISLPNLLSRQYKTIKFEDILNVELRGKILFIQAKSYSVGIVLEYLDTADKELITEKLKKYSANFR